MIKMDTIQTKVKMSGYLCKKSKKRVIYTWKTYWFVLEDRLLLFYRSKNEYEAISPCKGSINLGPPCTVKSFPSIENSFQIETRTNTFTLKAANPEEQIKWMQTIMAALNQNQNFVSESQKRLSHFRYSLNNLIPEREPNDTEKDIFERKNSMPHNTKLLKKNNSTELIQRIQKIGGHSYGGNLDAITKSTKKSTSPIRTRPTITLEESIISSSDSEHSNKILPNFIPRDNNIYERISGESNSSHGSNRVSFMVDNENYSVPVRRPKSSVGQKSNNLDEAVKETQSLLVENDQYIPIPDYKNGVIYAEPNITDNKNVNGNSLIKENFIYTSADSKPNICSENIYEDLENTDVNRNSVLRENSFYRSADIKPNTSSENVYEDLENYNILSAPVEADRPCTPSSTKPCINSHEKKKPNQKLKKSRSFIRIGWKKRNKKKLKDQQEQNDRLFQEDSVALNEKTDRLFQEDSATLNEKTELSNENTLQMLSELQNILENKKSKLKTVVSNSSNSGNDQPWNTDQSSEPSLSQISDCPSIPPKQQNIEYESTTIKSNGPEQFRSLDEILEDLDKEKVELGNSVQKLIEKFDDPSRVVLRGPKKPQIIPRHSDDLNKLLEELAKVTCAPIMTPGATSSLVNPNLTDAEWKKLLPIRQRRLSEPDYDIPRSHKSITLPIEPENFDAIPVTRFFGPVLAPAVTDNLQTEESFTSSMTPDSLEVESRQKDFNQVTFIPQNTVHTEIEKNRCFSSISHDPEDKIIYSMPKSCVSVSTHIANTCNIYGNQFSDDYIIYKNVKNEVDEEVYSDSLEVPHEQPKY